VSLDIYFLHSLHSTTRSVITTMGGSTTTSGMQSTPVVLIVTVKLSGIKNVLCDMKMIHPRFIVYVALVASQLLNLQNTLNSIPNSIAAGRNSRGCPRLDWIGDNKCDEINDIKECNWDGEDCS